LQICVKKVMVTSHHRHIQCCAHETIHCWMLYGNCIHIIMCLSHAVSRCLRGAYRFTVDDSLGVCVFLKYAAVMGKSKS